ncbi:MAG: histidine kinase [Betaproteobacteria bacterium]|nr:histidine kinase [Betaproteobacteria bacterium]
MKMDLHILTLHLNGEQDVVLARQRARQIAQMTGFAPQDQTRIATAVSEIARNAFRYGAGGSVEFAIAGLEPPQLLLVTVIDQGGGIADLQSVLEGRYRSSTGMGMGLIGSRRLMDQCDIDTSPRGTRVVLKKLLPEGAPPVTAAILVAMGARLAAKPIHGTFDEVLQQNRELLRALGEMRQQHDELLRLTNELEDTNRGVVALYAELDETANHLRRADEMKSRFLSNMSHEFRTPLSSIRALAKLLLSHVDGPLTPDQETQVGFINKGAEDLAALVDDLLDLAKIETGKVEVLPAEFTVADLFSALRGMLRPLLVTDTVELVFDEALHLPQLYTDEAKVSQILRNFISNALKFTKLGEIRVTAALAADDPLLIEFTVSDTGIGIAQDHQDLIFEEFTQIQSDMQKSVKGTGLGLPLCKKLAELLGGSIALHSEPGRGSVFTARLPLRFAQPADHGRPEAAVAAPATVVDPLRLPILIVEDEPPTRLLYENYLRGTIYQSVAASSLREAREVLARMAPRAIVLDILLPGEDAWNWLARFKSEIKQKHIPVIVATRVEDARKGLALGADAYFVKPLEREDLIATLNSLVLAQPGAAGEMR